MIAAIVYQSLTIPLLRVGALPTELATCWSLSILNFLSHAGRSHFQMKLRLANSWLIFLKHLVGLIGRLLRDQSGRKACISKAGDGWRSTSGL